LAEDDPKEALRWAEVAIAQGQALSSGHSTVKESIAIALEAALRLEDLDKVEEILRIVHTDAVMRRTRFYRAHAARIEARLPDRSDQDAERLFEESVAAFRAIQMPFRVGIVLLEHGEWLDARGRGDEAGPFVAEARSIFEDLRAQPWLERADRVAQGSPVTS
jgi:hypothetical protein